MTATATATVPALTITLTRAEGPSPLPAAATAAGPDVWADARALLRGWSYTAPRSRDAVGVDKVDFVVAYADGQTYSGTFGLTDTDLDLPAHMRRHLDAVATHPLFDAADRADAAAFLTGYAIG